MTDLLTSSTAPRSPTTRDDSAIGVTPAVYDFLVSKPGFSTSKLASQRVEVGLTLTLNVSCNSARSPPWR